MGEHKERLDRGLVTVRDASLLEEGQLSEARNAILKASTNALHRATGRTLFGAVSATAVDVNGLRDATFNNGNRYLIAHASATYLTAALTADTGTFNALVSGVGVGSQLEVVHYRNRFFLFNGTSLTGTASAGNSNNVFYLTATATTNTPFIRQHGMKPVQEAPTVTTATTGLGTFSQTTTTGYYEYWTTEIAKIKQDSNEVIVEGTFQSNTGPTTVTVSASGVVPVIQLSKVVNPMATHWRIYRSPKKDRESDKKFPTGFMISEIAITSATATGSFSQADSLTVASASAFPTLFNSGADAYKDAVNASALATADGNYASFTTQANAIIGNGPPQILTNITDQGTYGYNFGGFVGAVKGIVIETKAFIASGNGPVPVGITIGRRDPLGKFEGEQIGGVLPGHRGRSVAKSALLTATGSGSPQTLTYGASADRWFANDYNLPFVDSDFNLNTWMVKLGISKPSVTVSADYIKTTVYYAGTFDSVIPFPTVVYTFGDVTSQVGKNGPPPSSSTGDIFEDCLVVNDVDAPSVVKYSYPGDPEAFPATYYIEFATPANDQVRLVKTVNNRLVVGLDTSLWRVNYLPSERDASFDRGKARECISPGYGCVNAMCACTFSPGGGTSFLAGVSHKGIWITDGFSFEFITDSLEWRNVISLTSTSTPIALIDDPEEFCLRFFYRNDSNGNETYLQLLLHYDEKPIRVSGPVHMRNFHGGSSTYGDLKSAWSVPRLNGNTSVYFGYGGTATAASAGTVMLESGTTIPANDSTWGWSTRRMFLAGEGNEWKADDLYFYTSTYTGAPTFIVTPKTVKTNDGAGEVTKGSKTRVLTTATAGGERIWKQNFAQIGEGIRWSISSTASAAQCEWMLIKGTDFDSEDSGK